MEAILLHVPLLGMLAASEANRMAKLIERLQVGGVERVQDAPGYAHGIETHALSIRLPQTVRNQATDRHNQKAEPDEVKDLHE